MVPTPHTAQLSPALVTSSLVPCWVTMLSVVYNLGKNVRARVNPDV